MRTMCMFLSVAHYRNASCADILALILMVSRLCLTVEYCSILWHVRKFKKARLPLYLQIAILFSAAMVYLGIAFRFRDKNSQVYIVWYIISALEALLTIAISNFWSVLRFTETHLMKRMSLLTIVILGDGVVIIAQKVVDIVGTSSSWSTLLTFATATLRGRC